MLLTINGNQEEIAGELTIQDLLVTKNVESPDMVSVELNGTIISRNDFTNVTVKENDTVEFLYFIGGGSSQ
ncbi:sulfur carrier protein ThiS [Methanosphaerula palustris]|uniref:Thiamine biosynthesis protein ThiS n=1 Tax=Methanosphaerula palustris (strain ATCC BAA-1556 / DSM 19958 / E1-9c) TaxID=521011 RepID=B8GH81_METPE|nr:sulfur carrier protein ThiS [Methanosphaerula palustris]ACL16486.1 thiamine biosynthesis protein ThiS [Methanosphaerula palustris E1-9c]